MKDPRVDRSFSFIKIKIGIVDFKEIAKATAMTDFPNRIDWWIGANSARLQRNVDKEIRHRPRKVAPIVGGLAEMKLLELK